jgi:ribosomal protein S18 acetylase RimI-like enzyme
MTTIRRFRETDADATIELWRMVFPEYDDPGKPQRDPRANLVRKLAVQPELFWVAEDEGAIVGTVMAGYDGHRGWIYALGVHPTRRRLGLGRRLLEHAQQVLWELGCPKINLQVHTLNSGARLFYERLGYVADEVVSYGKRAPRE